MARDRTVRRSRAVALPGGRVQDDGPLVGRVGQLARVVVGLRAADHDRALVEVVVPEHPLQPVPRRLAGDEAVVVGLELVRGHVHLVALAMVDEDVPAGAVPEHLEVLGVLVDVQHDADVLFGQRALEGDDRPDVGRRDRRLLEQLRRSRRTAAEDEDGPLLRQFGERPVPLSDLVHVDGTVREVHGHLVAPRLDHGSRLHLRREDGSGPSVGEQVLGERDGTTTVSDQSHVSSSIRQA